MHHWNSGLQLLARVGLTWGLAITCVVAAPADTLRIGLIGPFTGPTADTGNSMRLGAELAVQEINQVGGYLGRRLELVLRDDRSDPDTGRRAAEELVQRERVHFTLGFCNTGVAMKALDVFQAHQHLLMVPCATGTAITRKFPASESMVFRLAPNDALQTQFLISEVVDRRRLRKVAILADETGYGEGGLKDLAAELSRRGLKPVHVGRFPVNVESLAEHLAAARRSGANALITYTIPAVQAKAIRARQEIEWNVPYFAPWALSSRDLREAAGPRALEGAMVVQTIIHDVLNERRTSFLARYYRHSQDKRVGSLMAAAQSYDAVHLMLRALFETKGETRGGALKQALENLPRPYQGVVTTYRQPFDAADHDAFAINMLWLGVWRKGEIEYESSEDAKRASFVRHKQGSAGDPRAVPGATSSSDMTGGSASSNSTSATSVQPARWAAVGKGAGTLPR